MGEGKIRKEVAGKEVGKIEMGDEDRVLCAAAQA
jgi:hypothetical protein